MTKAKRVRRLRFLERWKRPVPKELRPYLPGLLIEFAQPSVMLPMMLFMLAVLFYGASRHPNAWCRLIPPAVGPLLGMLFLLLRPFNPYHSYSAYRSAMEWKDVSGDPVPKRIVALLRSKPARWLILRTGMVTCIVFLGITLTLLGIRPAPRTWQPWYFDVVAFSFLWAAVSLGILYHVLMRWLLRVWEPLSEGANP